MPRMQDISLQKQLEQSLSSDPVLAKDVTAIVSKYPDTAPIFQRLVTHLSTRSDETQKRPSKRPKLEDHKETSSVPKERLASSSTEAILRVPELSIVTPIRKKLDLTITSTSIAASIPGVEKFEIEVPVSDIRCIALLPVPEKAAKMWNYCIFRISSDEAVVFTVPDSAPKMASGSAMSSPDKGSSSSCRELITSVFNQCLQGLKVSEPSTQDFVSALPQPHRKHEPAVHVTAHRGSKEGYLFFLAQGLVYGFKRPLLFIPLENIQSVTYNDILQRTFNLTVTVTSDGTEDSHEFSMIDISEHDRVDKYIRKYQLNDASLSEARRAKVANPKNVATESEISKAADEIAAGISGNAPDNSDDEDDAEFRDDDSHGGSTLASDESDASDADDQNEGSVSGSEEVDGDESEDLDDTKDEDL